MKELPQEYKQLSTNGLIYNRRQFRTKAAEYQSLVALINRELKHRAREKTAISPSQNEEIV